MTLNAIRENRREFDRALSLVLRREKEELLEKMGQAHRLGLRVWYFGGPSAKDRDPRQIPLSKIREFVRYYAPSAA
jgi:hypothetical protein